jgi:hypothetical protein
MVPTDLASVLLWCVPGLVVMVGGQALVWRAFFAGRRRSPTGLRLSMIGSGLIGLGGMAGLAIAAVGQGRWPVALLVVVVFGWWPAFFFWWATRPRVTARD